MCSTGLRSFDSNILSILIKRFSEHYPLCMLRSLLSGQICFIWDEWIPKASFVLALHFLVCIHLCLQGETIGPNHTNKFSPRATFCYVSKLIYSGFSLNLSALYVQYSILNHINIVFFFFTPNNIIMNNNSYCASIVLQWVLIANIFPEQRLTGNTAPRLFNVRLPLLERQTLTPTMIENPAFISAERWLLLYKSFVCGVHYEQPLRNRALQILRRAEILNYTSREKSSNGANKQGLSPVGTCCRVASGCLFSKLY